jgi:RNA polymerase sigma-70 factor (ECF subfamily)
LQTTRPSLLLRIRDPRDAAAWEVFDSIYRPMLRRYALSRGLLDAEAEDIAQQCLTEVLRRIGDFEYDAAKGRFKGWLKTMVANRVRNLWRDRRERQADTAVFERDASPEPSPDESFEKLWMQEHLWHCFRAVQAQVDETTWRAFEQYVLRQRTIDEVCRELNLKAQNVYTIKWRLTERIAAMMKELLGKSQ